MKKFVLLVILFQGIAGLMAEPIDSSYSRDPYFLKLIKTNSQVPIFYNDQVKRQIANYVRNLNNSTAVLLGKTQYYQHLYGAKFDSAGIPKQLRSKVFERFYRADNSRNRETGGNGIGLAIVKTIVERHGGKIVAVETPGGGATFRVTLPLQ